MLCALVGERAVRAPCGRGWSDHMNVIFFSRRNGKARQFNLSHPITLTVISILGLSLLVSTFAAGLTLGQRSMARMALLSPTAALRAEQQQLGTLRAQVQD